jgi:hypothetical protein
MGKLIIERTATVISLEYDDLKPNRHAELVSVSYFSTVKN